MEPDDPPETDFTVGERGRFSRPRAALILPPHEVLGVSLDEAEADFSARGAVDHHILWDELLANRHKEGQ